MQLILALIFLSLTACQILPKPKPGGESPLGVKTCESIPGTKHPAKFCHWKTCDVSKGTLWYMHGLMESEEAGDAPGNPIIGTQGHVEEFKQMAKARCFDLVVISYGKSWMIRPPGTLAKKPPSPSWAEFNNIVLPFLEKKATKPYIGYGQSMGGFNLATITNLKPNFFSKAIVTHPVIADFPGISWAAYLISTHFTIGEWRIADPRRGLTKATELPPTYVASCEKDQFGLWSGPKQYAEIGIAKGFNVTFHKEPEGCTHMTLDLPPVLEWMKK